MLHTELIHTLNVQNTLGEGVIWDHRNQTLWWTDIEASLLFNWRFGEDAQSIPLPERLGSFGLTRDPHALLCAFESGFALFSPSNGNITWLCKVEQDKKDNRLNDGRVDRQGRYWAGSMNEGTQDKTGTLYRLDAGLAIPMDNQIQISNGLCWNQSGTTMYFADSPSRQIQRFDFDPQTGTLGKSQIFARTERGVYPDGACVDTQDNLWSAHWGAGVVRCYTSSAEQLTEVNIPCPQPSCVALGGPDMQHLFVTTARVGLSTQQLAQFPQSGNLFIFKTDAQGVHEEICADESMYE